MTNEILTQARVKELFDYDGKQLIRKTNVSSNARAGDVAGYITDEGYRRVHVNNKMYTAHRLIWLWVYGYFPKGQIDHINGKPDDNQIKNLRDVDQSANMRNQKKRTDNKSGITGVYLHQKTGKWHANIWLDNRCRYLGSFDCKYRAASVRHFAMELIGGYTARHGK